MSYFPSDIPFMSYQELKENGIKLPEGKPERIDVTIYKLDVSQKEPKVEVFPAVVQEVYYGEYQVLIAIGPNDWDLWHSEYDIKQLGIVYEPLDNIIELIVRRDGIRSDHAAMLIQDYCCKKAASFRKKLDMFNRGIGAATKFYIHDGWCV